jgi:hypothetical protein
MFLLCLIEGRQREIRAVSAFTTGQKPGLADQNSPPSENTPIHESRTLRRTFPTESRKRNLKILLSSALVVSLDDEYEDMMIAPLVDSGEIAAAKHVAVMAEIISM